MELNNLSTIELLEELKSRGIFSKSPVNDLVLKKYKENDNINIKLVLSLGQKNDQMDCTRCNTKFMPTVYQSRVAKDGYFINPNSVCDSCLKNSDKEKKGSMKKAISEGRKIEKPKKGDICPKCNKPWFKSWHADHVGDTFNQYTCLPCNTGKQDHREKAISSSK